MNVDPGRRAYPARVNLDWPVEYAGKRRKRKSGNEFPLACDATGHRQASWRERGLNEQLLREKVAEVDALDEGGRGPESAALTARYGLPLSGISDYTASPPENQRIAATRTAASRRFVTPRRVPPKAVS